MDLIERLTKEVERIEDEAGSETPMENAIYLLGIVTDEVENAAAVGAIWCRDYERGPTLSNVIHWLRSTDRWTK